MLPIKLISSAGSTLLRASVNPIRRQSELGGLVGLASAFLPSQTSAAGASGLLYFQTREISRWGGNKNFKKDFFVLKDRPVGPHMTLAPGVKHEGRIGEAKNYRYQVLYPEDGKYTIKKLPIKKLAGRDPVTGRKVVQGYRGGAKKLYRWIDWRRLPADWDKNGPDLVERVVNVCYDPNRKPMIALTGYGDKLRWQIATENMKVGDLIRTSAKIPSMPVKPIEGDSHPLGALPVGTTICLVQWYPDSDVVKVYAERESAKIVRKVGDRVVIQRDSKLQYSLDERCQCVVGKVSIHPLKAMKIGSPNRARWMGIGPRSGLWHRKTGHAGRKIKALPPCQEVNPPAAKKDFPLLLHVDSEGIRGAPALRKRPFKLDKW